jgi:glycosyltransferase involved in cell wall biosynthesis
VAPRFAAQFLFTLGSLLRCSRQGAAFRVWGGARCRGSPCSTHPGRFARPKQWGMESVVEDRNQVSSVAGGGQSTGRVRVLLIGHQFQVPTEGQAKAAALARFADVDLHVLTPALYREGEVRWRRPVHPVQAGYRFQVSPVRMAWSGPAKWYLQWYPKLAATLSTLRPDVIDIWEEPWSLLSAQICRLRDRVLPAAKIISETEQNIAKRLPPPFEAFRRFTLGKANFLIGRNTEAVQVAREKGFRGPAAVVGNGVDTELFSPASARLDELPRGRDSFRIGYAGRLVREKGLDVLLEAVGSLPAPRSLVLSGEGPFLERMHRAPFVHWAGNVPRERLPAFYRGLDVLVLPSHTTARWKEQFGRVLVEAQACGIPVVGSSSGAIPEVIGDAGLVFPEGNAAYLAVALQRLRADASLRRTLACKGLERACLHYGWNAIAAQMRQVYLSVVGLR